MKGDMSMRIGLIGYGQISSFLLEKINSEHLLPGRKITHVYSQRTEDFTQLNRRYDVQGESEWEQFLNHPFDLVVEASTIETASMTIKDLLSRGIPVVISSIGMFADPQRFVTLQQLAEEKKATIYLPSGAIGGLDLIRSAQALQGLKEVTLRTTKPPTALPTGVPSKQAQLLFSGSAAEAIQHYPRNMNVAIALSLAGIGMERTQVEVWVDPAIEKNTHEIKAIGEFGKMQFVVENEPMPNNEKTSLLAAWSVFEKIQSV